MRRLLTALAALIVAAPAFAGTTWGGHKTVKPRGSRGGAVRPGGTRGGSTRGGAARGGSRPGATPAGGAAAEDPDAEPPKPAVQVEKSKDVVILTDGTKIVGTIIAVGQKRLLIIEEKAKTDRAIDRSEVESFRRGASERKTVSYDVNKDAYKGVLVLAEQGEADPAAPGPEPIPGPKVKPGPKPNPKPEPKPAPAKLGELWKLLEGDPSAAQIGAAFKKNGDWKAQVTKLIKAKKLPAEGQRAFNKLKKRVLSDKGFRDGLAVLMRNGTLPHSVLEVLTAK